MYRIMAVEDDPMMQMLLRDVIRGNGHEFVLCKTGAEALKSVGERPDLVLLDIHLPDMNGKDVCRALKTDPATRHIPVIMLTGEARSLEERVSGFDVGADDYLLKPVSPKALNARILSLVRLGTRPT
jgi:DNA-binding response OmpR family regulator